MFKIIIALLTVCVATTAQAQVSRDSELFKSLKEQDKSFFEKGFNQCDMDYLRTAISENLTFYHDQSGFQDRQKFLENVEKYIVGKDGKKPIRKLKEGSLVVFPLYDAGVLYGAIQKGTHHFYIRESGKKDVWTSTAKFTHVWTLNDDKWIVSSVLSYDHRDPETKAEGKETTNESTSDNGK